MYDIYYIGAQNSEKLNLCQWPYMVTGGDIFSSSYSEVEENDHIQNFERKVTDYTLNIEIQSSKNLAQAVDKLMEITEKDIINVTPGRLYVGNSYLKCWLSGTNIGRWVNDLDSVSSDLTVRSDYPYWITEQEFHFLSRRRAVPDHPGWNFPLNSLMNMGR